MENRPPIPCENCLLPIPTDRLKPKQGRPVKYCSRKCSIKAASKRYFKTPKGIEHRRKHPRDYHHRIRGQRRRDEYHSYNAKERRLVSGLWHFHRITVDTYRALIDRQGGVCAI